MSLKRKIQLGITTLSLVFALVHIILPGLSIDMISITLLVIAVIPWLETLFKTVELPGGLKVEFQELKEVEYSAKKAGLIKDKPININEEESKQSYETYSFIEIAEKNQELALVGLRIEIEKRLRKIADKYSIESNRYSIARLLDALGSDEVLTYSEVKSLKDMINVSNHAAHGIEYNQQIADWVIDIGPKILVSLDEKLQEHSGRISLGEDDNQHWIDKSYANCEWTTNGEWGSCITKHTDLWKKELQRIYESLLKKLDEPKCKLLIESQSNWEKQFDLDSNLISSFEDLQFKIGTAGFYVIAINTMNKIRERTLELGEILDKLAE